MCYSNEMFLYMFKAEFVTLVRLKVPSGLAYTVQPRISILPVSPPLSSSSSPNLMSPVFGCEELLPLLLLPAAVEVDVLVGVGRRRRVLVGLGRGGGGAGSPPPVAGAADAVAAAVAVVACVPGAHADVHGCCCCCCCCAVVVVVLWEEKGK